MRLSAEVLDHIKKWYAKCEEADCMPENGLTIGQLLDTIEALQQENKQLLAQVTRMRKALTVANNYMPDIGQFCTCGKCKTCGADINYAGYEHCVKCARVIIDEALATDKDEQTEQMKYLLRRALPILEVTNDQQELIDAINALIGGKEDI